MKKELLLTKKRKEKREEKKQGEEEVRIDNKEALSRKFPFWVTGAQSLWGTLKAKTKILSRMILPHGV